VIDQALNGLFNRLLSRLPRLNVDPEAFPAASILESDVGDLGDPLVNALNRRLPPPTGLARVFDTPR
jgi:hypothetical protein